MWCVDSNDTITDHLLSAFVTLTQQQGLMSGLHKGAGQSQCLSAVAKIVHQHGELWCMHTMSLISSNSP